MPPSKCTATRKWNHNLTTRTRVVGVRMLNGPRRTLDAWLRKRYALVCPYETLNRLDIDREDIMSSTFRARTTYPPEVALYPLIVHIGPERARSYRTNDRKDMPLPREPPRRDLQFRPLLHGFLPILPFPARKTFLTNTNYFSSLIEIAHFRAA